MNRMEEFQELIKELEIPHPELEGTLDRVIRRKRRQNAVIRPLMGFVASFVLFVLIVNTSGTVAYACSQIPILRELAQAVTFSRSLSKAVENEYLQEINLIQKEGDITAEIPYLIVDQKSVVVFYKLDSEKYEVVSGACEILSADGTEKLPVGYVNNNLNIENGELTYIRIEFEEDIPSEIKFVMDVVDKNDVMWESSLAQFEFLLAFDPKFTTGGNVIELNKTVEMNGQEIIIQSLEIYPTSMHVNVSANENNTAWLKDLDFYIQTEKGMFAQGVDGIISTGSMEENRMVSYRAESIYFYNAKEINLVITGAKWIEKDQELAYLNLKTGENSGFPENVKFDSVKRRNGEVEVWVDVEQLAGTGLYSVFDCYYDAEGNEHHFAGQGWSAKVVVEGEKEYISPFGIIKDYSQDEVWIKFNYTEEWRTEIPIMVEIK